MCEIKTYMVGSGLRWSTQACIGGRFLGIDRTVENVPLHVQQCCNRNIRETKRQFVSCAIKLKYMSFHKLRRHFVSKVDRNFPIQRERCL